MSIKTLLRGFLPCLLLLSAPAMAHEFILKPDTAVPAKGQKVGVQAQAAHVFMISDEAENPDAVSLRLLQNGTATAIPLHEDKALKSLAGTFTLGADGPALLVGHRSPQIWCETTRGEMAGSRADLEAKGFKVRSAGKYEKFAKTLLNPRASDTAYKQLVGQDLEIIALDNPAGIKPGDAMTVQVLLRGKPAADVPVGISHEGFSPEPDAYKATARTDAQGKAVFTPDKPALWLVRAAVTEKMPGGDADQHHLRATYVFPVQ